MTFSSSFEQLSASFDREKLLGLATSLAHLLPPDRREEALLLVREIGGNAPVVPEPLPAAETQRILDEIDDLHLDILSRIEAIENGSFEELDDFDGYDDEPDLVSNEQLALLAGFFAEAGLAFARNDKPAAEKMYEALFKLVDEVEETGILSADDIDLRRERARYARCVYESTAAEGSLPAVLSVMGLAETLAARNEMVKAQNLMREYRRVLFPRHTAFHRERRPQSAVRRSSPAGFPFCKTFICRSPAG